MLTVEKTFKTFIIGTLYTEYVYEFCVIISETPCV